MKDMKAERIVIRSSHHGDWIRVSISDSGPGISMITAEKSLNPSSTKENSTGIGLSLCQRIIMDHKGSMGVATSVMGGADFAFTLPVST